jgi:hypothetical protein
MNTNLTIFTKQKRGRREEEMIFLTFWYHQSVLQMASIVAQIEITAQIDYEKKFERIFHNFASFSYLYSDSLCLLF